ncbi:MAG: hypothetical protein PHD31_00575 [Candidatus Pacebacteria bacterium]|nr:hypothetical protein [Candidatus Paceibacterota bacterium]
MNILTKYLYWQFIISPKKVLVIARNYLLFGSEFFSIKETIKSLFSPWKMITWSYGRGVDIGKYFEAFISNIFTRIIGFIMRTMLIIAFIVYELIIFISGIVAFIFILIYPFLALLGIIYGLRYFNV